MTPVTHARRRMARNLDALAERLSHWSINLSPRALSLQEGVRAAVACAMVVAVMQWGHWPLLAWSAISALWTCLADPGGSPRRRREVLVGYGVLSTLFALVGAGAAGLGLGWAALAIFLCVLISGAVSAWGSAWRQAGLLALVACVVAADSPKSNLIDLLAFGVAFAGGSLWAIVLSLTIWRIHPFRPGRAAVADSFLAMGVLAADLGALAQTPEAATASGAWARATASHRGEVRAAIEAARAAVDELLRARRQGPEVNRLLLAIEVAETVFTHLIALDEIVQSQPAGGDRRLVARCVRLAGVMLRDTAKWLRTDGAHDTKHLDGQAEMLAHRPWAGTPVLTAIARDLHALELREPRDAGAERQAMPGTAAPKPPAPRPAFLDFKPLLDELNWNSLLLRQVLRGAVLATAVTVAAHLLGLPRAYWATMALILVHQGQIATTWARALERSLGSIAGGAIALVVGWALASPVLLTLAVFPLAMATLAMRRVNYALFVMFLTPLFVLVTEITQPGANPLAIAGYRVVDNVLGCAIAMIGASVLWPVKEGVRLGAALAAAIETNGRYAALAFRPDADPIVRDAARRAAGLASARAERSRDRVAMETPMKTPGGGGGRGLEPAAAILATLRQLTGGATVAWLHPPAGHAPGDAIAEWLGQATHALAAAVRHGVPPQIPAPPPAADSSQEQALQRLSLLMQGVIDYLAARASAAARPARPPSLGFKWRREEA